MKCYSLVLYLHPWYAVILQYLRMYQISLLIPIPSSVLTPQDEEFANILEDLDCSKITSDNANLSDEIRLSGYFCQDTVLI